MPDPVLAVAKLVVGESPGERGNVGDSGRTESHGTRGFEKIVQDRRYP